MAFLWWTAWLALSGCGRFGFDATTGGGDDAQPGAVTLRYPIDTAYGIRNVTPISLVPEFTGAPTFTTVLPLPAGVSIDATTGVITGVPQTSLDKTVILVRATGATGTASAKVTLVYSAGYAVDVTSDGEDDDLGNDLTCFSSVAGGCSLRAAMQTANAHATELQVITVGPGVFSVIAAMPVIDADIVIVGVGPKATTVRSQPALAGFGLFKLGAPRRFTLVRAGFANFGMRDGAVVAQFAGTMAVDECLFENNQSAGSGGVFFITSGAKASIRRSTFLKNESFGGCCGGWGGVVDGEGAMTSITISQSYASGNRSNWGSFAHITDGTQLWLENSTLYGNRATTAGTLASPGGAYTLVNDTIVYNTNTNPTPESAGLYLYSDPAHYTVQSSIVAFNTDITGSENNCNRRVPTVSLTSLGGNVMSDAAGNCASYFIEPGDQLGLDPELVAGGPGANGGPTDTLPPRPTSPVLDVGSACPSEDQRGEPRDPAICDSGAVELP